MFLSIYKNILYIMYNIKYISFVFHDGSCTCSTRIEELLFRLKRSLFLNNKQVPLFYSIYAQAMKCI